MLRNGEAVSRSAHSVFRNSFAVRLFQLDDLRRFGPGFLDRAALEDGAEKAAQGASIAVVPLTIPLLTGPATMSTVVIYADKAKTFLQLATLVGYGVVVALLLAVVAITVTRLDHLSADTVRLQEFQRRAALVAW